ncbi:unnamed protein product [Urochloa decumbens]|uniref:DUF1618 domain-containing protein n=1 Tax=Urochloa decumbens TaxID=240449 RepID=A0ABC9E4B4_9POAL
MKIPTTRLALGGFVDGLTTSVFRRQRRRSIAPLRRFIHLAPGPGCGGGRPTEPSDSPAAADPRWVLLDRRDCRRNDSLAAAAGDGDNTAVAECRTSTGHRLLVSSGLVSPPASSFLYYTCSGAAAPDDDKDGGGGNSNAPTIIAAHADSVLLRMHRPRDASSSSSSPRSMAATFDHFVYRSGAAGRPPSLSLLPPRNIPTRYEDEEGRFPRGRDPYNRILLGEDTAVLRRGGDELLIIQLELIPSYSDRHGTADLCVLRLGNSAWEQKRSVPIVHDEGDELPGPLTGPSMAIPVGDRFLCWFCYNAGFLLLDMGAADDEASPNPKFRYFRLPGLLADDDQTFYSDELPPLTNSQGMGAAGDAAVRLVAVEPRCCCGGLGRTSCPRSRFAFTVTTWTMSLTAAAAAEDVAPVAWVKDGVMDCEELWALPGYKGVLPRVHLQQPLVSLDDPDVVCFKVVSDTDWRKVWMIQVDMRRKELLAAVQCSDTNPAWGRHCLTAKLQ